MNMLEWITVRYSTGEFVMGVFTAKRDAEGPQPGHPRAADAVPVDGTPGQANRDEKPCPGAGQPLQEALLPA
jgi:hypothetical protein